MEKIFENVFLVQGKIATKNLAEGSKVYGERLVREREGEYRIWDLYRSKLAAAIRKGLKELPIKEGSRVLYLGAASGTTASHVSDIVGEKGVVFCIEFAQRSIRDLIGICEKRKNMAPILADARKPRDYSDIGQVDVIYEDVAQPNQDEILLANAKAFLKKGGFAMIAIKSQSIDVTAAPKKMYEQVKVNLQGDFEILQEIELSPFDKDHLFLLLRKKD
ncbi:fibrillarin [Candidatus Micrarchaeota archaeon CG11_big_fil_rev_8_21_14_0_20_47_5]|nr:MAG: fibrillarin [Candidatus Micrarchaeota archaeon CG1_02_47_40]PIN83305.1 MAG: fibrillarin [Candidatus Micrarchaeota archaeon CG11_big_fil_rev_8_21_14_0_20_47_5]